MAFFKEKINAFFSQPVEKKRSDHRLKKTESTVDPRSWVLDEELKRQQFLNVVNSTGDGGDRVLEERWSAGDEDRLGPDSMGFLQERSALQLEEKMKTLEGEKNFLKNVVADKENEIEQLLYRIQAMFEVESIPVSTNEMMLLQTHLNELVKQYNSKDEELKKTKDLLRNTEKMLKQLQALIESTGDDPEKQKMQLNQVMKDLEGGLQDDIETLEGQVKTYEEKLKNANAEIEELKKNLLFAQEQIEAFASGDDNELNKIIMTLQNDLNNLNISKNAENIALREIIAEKDSKLKTIGELKSDQDIITKYPLDIRDELRISSDFQQSTDSPQIKYFQDLLSQKDNDIAVLKNKLDIEQRENSALKDTLKMLADGDGNDLDNKVLALANKLKDLESMLNSERKSNEKLRNELQNEREKIEKLLSADEDDLKNILVTAEKENASLKKEKEIDDKLIKSLNNEIDFLKRQIEKHGSVPFIVNSDKQLSAEHLKTDIPEENLQKETPQPGQNLVGLDTKVGLNGINEDKVEKDNIQMEHHHLSDKLRNLEKENNTLKDDLNSIQQSYLSLQNKFDKLMKGTSPDNIILTQGKEIFDEENVILRPISPSDKVIDDLKNRIKELEEANTNLNESAAEEIKQCKEDISNKNKEIQKLLDSIKALQKENNIEKSPIDNVSKKLLDNNNIIEQGDKSIKNENENLNNEISTINKRIFKTVKPHDIEKLEKENLDLKEENVKLKERLESISREIEPTSKLQQVDKYKQSDNEKSAVKENKNLPNEPLLFKNKIDDYINECEQQKTALIIENNSLKDQLISVSNELENLKNNYFKDRKEKEVATELDISIIQNENYQMKKEIKELMDKIQNFETPSKEIAAQIKKENETLKEKIQILESKLKGIENERVISHSKVADKSSQSEESLSMLNELQILKTVNSELSKENKDFKDEIESLKSKLASTDQKPISGKSGTDDIAKLKVENAKLLKDYDTLKNENEILNSKLSGMGEKSGKVKPVVEDSKKLKEDNDKLLKENKELKNENDSLQQKLIGKDEKAVPAKEQDSVEFARLRAENAKLLRENDGLRKDIEILKSESVKIGERPGKVKPAEEDSGKLKEEYTKLLKENTDIKIENESLKQKAIQAKQEVSDELAKLESENAKLLIDYDTLKNENEILNSKLSGMGEKSGKVKPVVEDSKKLKEDNDKLLKENKELKSENYSLKQKASPTKEQVSDELAKLKSENAKLLIDYDNLKNENEILNSKLSEMSEKSGKVKPVVEDGEKLKENYDKLLKENKELKSENYSLKQKAIPTKEQVSDELAKLKSENAKLIIDYDALKSENEILNSKLPEMGEKSGKVKPIVEDSEKLKEKNAKLLQENKELKSENDSLKQKVIDKDEKHIATKGLDSDIEKLKVENIKLLKENDTLRNEIEKLKSKLNELEFKRDQLEPGTQNNIKLNGENEMLKEKLKQAERKIKKLSVSPSEVTIESGNLIKDSNALTDKINSLEKENGDLKSKINNLNNSLASANNKKLKYENENKQLQAFIKKAKEDGRISENEILNLYKNNANELNNENRRISDLKKGLKIKQDPKRDDQKYMLKTTTEKEKNQLLANDDEEDSSKAIILQPNTKLKKSAVQKFKLAEKRDPISENTIGIEKDDLPNRIELEFQSAQTTHRIPETLKTKAERQTEVNSQDIITKKRKGSLPWETANLEQVSQVSKTKKQQKKVKSPLTETSVTERKPGLSKAKLETQKMEKKFRSVDDGEVPYRETEVDYYKTLYPPTKKDEDKEKITSSRSPEGLSNYGDSYRNYTDFESEHSDKKIYKKYNIKEAQDEKLNKSKAGDKIITPFKTKLALEGTKKESEALLPVDMHIDIQNTEIGSYKTFKSHLTPKIKSEKFKEQYPIIEHNIVLADKDHDNELNQLKKKLNDYENLISTLYNEINRLKAEHMYFKVPKEEIQEKYEDLQNVLDDSTSKLNKILRKAIQYGFMDLSVNYFNDHILQLLYNNIEEESVEDMGDSDHDPYYLVSDAESEIICRSSLDDKPQIEDEDDMHYKMLVGKKVYDSMWCKRKENKQRQTPQYNILRKPFPEPTRRARDLGQALEKLQSLDSNELGFVHAALNNSKAQQKGRPSAFVKNPLEDVENIRNGQEQQMATLRRLLDNYRQHISEQDVRIMDYSQRIQRFITYKGQLEMKVENLQYENKHLRNLLKYEKEKSIKLEEILKEVLDSCKCTRKWVQQQNLLSWQQT